MLQCGKFKKQNIMEKRLTITEVADILLTKDPRTIKSYVLKGLIPQIAFDENTLTIDSVLLAKELGVKNFDEPFISEDSARNILGLSEKNNIHKFCKDNGINMYRLGNSIGNKFIFRESDFEEHIKAKLELLPYALEVKSRKNLASLIANSLVATTKLFNLGRAADILEMYISGYDIDKLGDRFELTGERVRQVLFKTTSRLRYRSGLIQSWIKVFSPTIYASMPAEEVLKSLIKLKEENLVLTEALLTKVGKDELKKIISTMDMEELEILNTPVEDLDLSVRLLNTLKFLEIEKFRDILKYSASDFAKYRNCGKKSLIELEALVREKGFKLKP